MQMTPRLLLSRLVLGFFVIPFTVAAAEPAILVATPPEVVLRGAEGRQQLVASLLESDGSARDLTHSARFLVEPPELAKVTPGGVVVPLSDGSGVLRVFANGLSTTVPLLVEQARIHRPVSFRQDVAAVLSKAGCNMGACHGNLNGKGGFRLSLRGEDPGFDHASMTRDSLGRRVALVSAESSLVVAKPSGRVAHEGGQRFAWSSPEARAILGWIASGAADDQATAPTVARLEVFPSERVLAAPGRSQQLVVTAHFSDGTRRDVTRQATYDVSDPTKASVTTGGLVEVNGPTETAIAVRYLTGRAVSRVAFLHDRPGFAWRERAERNVVDRHVFAKLKTLKILPSETATDSVFLRRAFLDAIGRPPTVAEARSFLDSTDPDKRSRLIDGLLERPEFADFWALKWADLLRNEEKTMGPKGVWVFQRWLRDQFAANVGLDAFARSLITAKGSTWTSPEASYYRTNRDPQTAAETFSQVFLGVRLQCARCHNHPFDTWTQDDYYGLAAYFSNIRQKSLANERKDALDKHEINGDEIIYLSGQPSMTQPRTGVELPPKAPQGPAARVGGDPDVRAQLADWLTKENPQFARNMANRVWFHLLGRGVVEPVDDFRESNPPSNPELLDALAGELASNGYRLRPLVRLIMNSEIYQLGSEPNETNAEDESNFARAAVRLLPAEVLLDAIGQALGRPGDFANLPDGLVATQLPGARMGGEFLKIFGKPDRLLTCECERSEATTLAQAFQLINGPAIRLKLEAPDNRVGRLLKSGAKDDEILEDLALAALGRAPTASEQAGFLAHVARAADRRKAWEDVAWALVNSKEFLLRH